MEVSEFISQLKQDLSDLKNQGSDNVNIDSLSEYLSEQEEIASLSSLEHEHAHARSLEHYKAKNEYELKKWEIDNQHSIEMFKSVILSGQTALKSSLLVNGGAAVAILGFFSKAWSNNVPDVVLKALPSSLLFYVMAILCAAIATGFTYVSQGYFQHDKDTLGKAMRIMAIVLIICSYVGFGMGSFQAYAAFSNGL